MPVRRVCIGTTHGLEGKRTRRKPMMVSTMKHTVAMAVFAAAGLAAASPASAQSLMAPASPGVAQPGFAFGNVNTPGPNGQCWVMTDKSIGHGYWGKCPEGAAAATVQAPSRRAQRQGTARAAVQSPPGAARTAPIAPGGRAASTTETLTTVGAAPPNAAAAQATVAPVAPQAGFAFANVNTPGPDGQCWVMTDKTIGYGYWGQCR
jgi:hypothetical protein